MKVEVKSKDVKLDKTRLKNLRGIKSWGGLLSLGVLRYINSNIIVFLFGV